jgi:hypothetical protein
VSSKEDIIISELARIREEVSEMRQTQLEQVADISALKVRTGIWSAFVSAIVAFAAVSWK